MKKLVLLAVMVVGTLGAMGKEAPPRAHKPGTKTETPCAADTDCDLNQICSLMRDGKRKCITGCRLDTDCKPTRICAVIRGCEDPPRCAKVCHAPEWTGP